MFSLHWAPSLVGRDQPQGSADHHGSATTSFWFWVSAKLGVQRKQTQLIMHLWLEKINFEKAYKKLEFAQIILITLFFYYEPLTNAVQSEK